MGRFLVYCTFVLLTASSYASDAKNDREYATVYVMRSNDNHKPIPSHINVNGDYKGSTYGETYLVIRLPKGVHNISSEMGNFVDLQMEVESSKTYFIQQRVNSSLFTPKSKLVQIEASKGLELIWRCKEVDGLK